MMNFYFEFIILCVAFYNVLFEVHARNAAIKNAQQRFSENNDLVVKPRLAGSVLMGVRLSRSTCKGLRYRTHHRWLCWASNRYWFEYWNNFWRKNTKAKCIFINNPLSIWLYLDWRNVQQKLRLFIFLWTFRKNWNFWLKLCKASSANCWDIDKETTLFNF